jgi:hypothetical protein
MNNDKHFGLACPLACPLSLSLRVGESAFGEPVPLEGELGLRWGGCAAKSAPFLGLNPDVESGRLSHEVLPERVFAAAISLRGGAPLPEVRVTTDNTAISRSCPIVILAGIWIPDLNTKGVIHIAANDLTVELAPGSELRGLPDGASARHCGERCSQSA